MNWETNPPEADTAPDIGPGRQMNWETNRPEADTAPDTRRTNELGDKCPGGGLKKQMMGDKSRKGGHSP